MMEVYDQSPTEIKLISGYLCYPVLFLSKRANLQVDLLFMNLYVKVPQFVPLGLKAND